MTTLRRGLLPLTIAALCLLAMAPTTMAKAAPPFPTQSLGNRGADVKAIQWLLGGRGYPVAVDGVFGATTQQAVVAHQTGIGLAPNGIVDDATWRTLIVRVSLGSTGPAVSAVQRELRAKRHLDVPVDGVFGASTRTAVRAFQKHAGSADHRHRQRDDLALAHLALRAAVVQQDLAVRLLGRQWQGELGDIGGHQSAGSGGARRRGGGARPGRGRGRLEAARRGHRRPRDPRARPRRRRPADAQGQGPVPLGRELPRVHVRPGGDPRAHRGHPGHRPGPRQAHLLQRPGARSRRAW